MRQKDWADFEAERLFDLVRNDLDDDRVIEEVAKSLRTTARDMTGARVTGMFGRYPSEEPKPQCTTLVPGTPKKCDLDHGHVGPHVNYRVTKFSWGA